MKLVRTYFVTIYMVLVYLVMKLGFENHISSMMESNSYKLNRYIFKLEEINLKFEQSNLEHYDLYLLNVYKFDSIIEDI